jgi:hypothetical protein
LIKTLTNRYDFGGFHTTEFACSGVITGQFSVVIKIQTPSYNYPIPAEEAISNYSSAATFATGQSFISSNGSSWQDTYFYPFDICIQAFGVPFVPLPPAPSHNWRKTFFTGR